jgi:predicted DNA-binding transcriptional regulator YafY
MSGCASPTTATTARAAAAPSSRTASSTPAGAGTSSRGTPTADWRTFRADRIEGTPAVDRTFAPREPPAEDIAAYVSRGVASTRDRWQARVVLHAALEDVAPRVPPGAGALEAIDERSCLLLTGSDWLGGLAVYVAEIGVDFEVLEPPELVERVRVLADRFRRAAPTP